MVKGGFILGRRKLNIYFLLCLQVFSQPIFMLVENWCRKRWPQSDFMTKEYPINIPLVGTYRMNFLRFIFRTMFVVFSTVIAIIFPFFNSIVGLIGALSFWPLTVYFPTEMYLVRAKVPKFSLMWIGLKLLAMICMIVTCLAAAGSIEGIVTDLKTYKPFK